MVRVFLIGLLAAAWCSPVIGAELDLDFTSEHLNDIPGGFQSVVGGGGAPAQWRVIMDDVTSSFRAASPKSPVVSKRPVLAQLSRDRTEERYPLLLYDRETFTDFTLSTQFKIVDGEVEQMAGIAFRVQDINNYYYIRASALGSNIYFLKWVDGKLYGPIGSKLHIEKGVWHDLVIECRGNEIRCRLNGKEAFPALQDSSFTSGKVGFWTKSDAVSHFGPTRIVYTRREKFAQTLVRDALAEYPRLLELKVFASPSNALPAKVIASTNPSEVGAAAESAEQDVLARATIYHHKGKGRIAVILPMRDANGDTVAAVKVVMKALPGQTEKNAITRAMPVVKLMESRLQHAGELLQ